MKTKLFTTFLLLLFSYIALGQRYSREFGQIDNSEMTINSPLAKDAEAIVLFDIGKSYFKEINSTFEVVFERTTRIKILSESGTKWAEARIPFYHEGLIYENVIDIEATSYNTENGKLVKSYLDISNTTVEKENEFWSVKKFTIPNVKEGTIIEYKYRINSQYLFNFRDWVFQWKIPVVYSEYVTKMIPFYEYQYILQGVNKLDVFESYEDTGIPRSFGTSITYGDRKYHDKVYRFGMKNVPAFGGEEFISSINDYIIKLDFQLSRIHHFDGSKTEIVTSWEELVKELLKHEDFGRYINKSERLSSKLINKKDIEGKSELEKFNHVLNYVKNNYQWNYYKDKLTTKTPRKLVQNKEGNSADINLFTIGLLKSIGIEAYPLILSTRDNGKIQKNYPFFHFFNYVVILAKVDGNTILADATEPLIMNNRIPPRCINDKGLVVDKKELSWINLDNKTTSNATTSISIILSNDELYSNIRKIHDEYDAFYYRNKYFQNFNSLKSDISKEGYYLVNSSLVTHNQTEKEAPYIIEYSVKSKPKLVDNKIYIPPFLHESLNNNPLTEKERRYPIDMIYSIRRDFKSSILIPDGYKVSHTPENININNELIELDYKTSQTNGVVEIIFNYHFKKAVYSSEDFAHIKRYFEEIVKKGNEEIVLEKML